MAVADLGVSGFFNEIVSAVKAYDASGNNIRPRVQKFISHMGPGNRSAGRHSNWPTSARLLLNDIHLDNRHFPVEIKTLNHIIGTGDGLMGLEYMGYEDDKAKGVAYPKFRFLKLAVPPSGSPSVGDDKVIVFFPDSIPAGRKDADTFTRLDAIVKTALNQGSPEHQRIVTEALRPGYADINAPARLRNLLAGTTP